MRLRGMNTEKDPRTLKSGEYVAFENLSQAEDVVRPRAGHTAYTPGVGSFLEWMLAKLVDYVVVEVYSSLDTATSYVNIPRAGGTVKISAARGVGEEDLVVPKPTQPPTLVSVTYDHRGTLEWPYTQDPGLENGQTGIYAFCWEGLYDEALTEIGPTLDVENDYLFIQLDYTSQSSLPAVGVTVTYDNAGPDQCTAICRGHGRAPISLSPFTLAWGFFIKVSEKSDDTKIWQSLAGKYVSWSGGPANKTLGEDEYSHNVHPVLSPTGSTTWSKWALLRLDEQSEVYRVIDSDDKTDTITDNTDFPYYPSESAWLDLAGTLIPQYDGPTTSQGLPDNLVESFDNAQMVAYHKACLFVASGEIVNCSEPERFRYFREKGASLRFPGQVIGMVSREEVLEVYTEKSAFYVIGNSPYFEFRELNVTDGPVSSQGIANTDFGTFALGDDGIHLYQFPAKARKNMTKGNNTPFIKALATPSDVIAGAANGVVWFVDSAGKAIAIDFERAEVFSSTFAAQPTVLLYDESVGALIARFPDTSHVTLETSEATAVNWNLQFGAATHGGKAAKLPSRFNLDSEGTIVLKCYVNEVFAQSMVLDGTGPRGNKQIPLPMLRGGVFWLTAEGSAKVADMVIRSGMYE